MGTIQETGTVLWEAASAWVEDRASQLGAALAFYSLLSLAPLLVIAIAVAAFFMGEQAAREELFSQLESTVGESGAGAIRDMLASAQQPKSGILATVLSLVTLLLGASALFGQLQTAMNQIWKVPDKEAPPDETMLGKAWRIVKDRLEAVGMVLGTGLLLLVSVVMSTVLSAAGTYFEGSGPAVDWIWRIVNEGVSLLVVTLLFAMIFKFTPNAEVGWRDVWVGAFLTALLFAAGKFGISLYLGKSSLGSAYGAAGSLVVLVVWIYYSAQILFFGAELTQVYARRHGSKRTERPASASSQFASRNAPAPS